MEGSRALRHANSADAEHPTAVEHFNQNRKWKLRIATGGKVRGLPTILQFIPIGT